MFYFSSFDKENTFTALVAYLIIKIAYFVETWSCRREFGRNFRICAEKQGQTNDSGKVTNPHPEDV